MAARPRRSRDPVQAAHQVYLEIIGEAPRQVPAVPDDSPAAVAKRQGASQGGERRAQGLTPERRREIARDAARVRWKRRTTEAGSKSGGIIKPPSL
jgi:hypothetical protein